MRPGDSRPGCLGDSVGLASRSGLDFLTIYIGPQAATITPGESDITGRRPARVFGQRVTWLLQDQPTEEGPPIHEADTTTTIRGQRVQLSIQSLDPAALDAALAIASSIR